MTSKEIIQFDEWFESDNVVTVYGGYITQCTQFVKTFGYNELVEYFFHEFIKPIRW